MNKAFLSQACILWLAGALGGAAVLPYAFAMQRETMLHAAESSGLGLPGLAAIAWVQTAVLLAVTVPLGLAAARKLGLRAPVSEALAAGGSTYVAVRSMWFSALVVGLGAVAVVIALERWVFLPGMPETFETFARSSLRHVKPWHGLLASLYGGITEEVLLRLFLLSVVALAIRWLASRAATELPVAVFWSANVIAALVFGAAHLPATAALVPLEPLVVVRALVLNGVIGLSCGWLYWRRGLESAMLAHFAADIVLHVIVPMISSW